MLHNYVVAHKASSLGRSGLSCQASQLVGAFIFFPTSPPAWRRTPAPKHRPMICVPQDSRRHAFNIAHQAGLHTPSTSRESLQLNQSSPALICPPEGRRCTPNQDRKLIRDNPKIRRSSLTFAAHLSLRNSTQQTQAGLSSVCDITFAAMHSLYTGERMARRKRAGLFPAYVLTRGRVDSCGSHKPACTVRLRAPLPIWRNSLTGKAAALKAVAFALGGSSPSSSANSQEAA